MEPRVSIISLGTRDQARAVRFYRDGLGWPLSSVSQGDFALFVTSAGSALALYPRHLLAAEAGVGDSGGFGGVTLAHNVSSREEVDRVLAQAVAAGGSLLAAARDTDWGGYSGYFADPEGHPWEVAWGPMFVLREGRLEVPV